MAGVGAGLVEEAQQFDRERHDQGAVLLGGHVDDRLEQAELEGRGVARHDAGGLRELLRGLELAVGGDDAGAALPLGLGLGEHGRQKTAGTATLSTWPSRPLMVSLVTT